MRGARLSEPRSTGKATTSELPAGRARAMPSPNPRRTPRERRERGRRGQQLGWPRRFSRWHVPPALLEARQGSQRESALGFVFVRERVVSEMRKPPLLEPSDARSPLRARKARARRAGLVPGDAHRLVGGLERGGASVFRQVCAQAG